MSSDNASSFPPPGRQEAQHPTGAGYATQFIATVRRQWIQKRRMACSTCLEIFLPVVFILGLVLASKATSTNLVAAEQFILPTTNLSMPPLPLDFNILIQSVVCYNGSDPILALAFPCALKNVSQFSPGPARFTAGRVPEGMLFNLFAGALLINSMSWDYDLPWASINFDNYVAVQWLARAIYGPNTKIFASGSQAMLQNNGKLFVVPQTTETINMVSWLNASTATFKYLFGGFYQTRDDIINQLITVSGEGTTWAVIIVDDLSANGFEVKLSLNQTNTPTTLSIRQRFSGGLGAEPARTYMVGGFTVLQSLLSSYYTLEVLKLPLSTTGTSSGSILMAPMGFGQYRNSAFLSIAGNISPLVLVLAFLYPVSQLSKRIVEEKETRLREGIMIMGLGKFAFFSSWIFNYVLQVLLTTFIVTFVLKVGILTQTDPSVIFCVYLFFGTSTITLSTLLSSFFSKSRITALVVPLLYFVLSIPSFALPDGTGRGVYFLLSLFSPTAFSLGTKLLFNYEINNGMGWNDVDSSLDEVNMGTVLFLLIFDTILYLILTLYLDEVLPSEWGTKQHPCFCCMSACCKCGNQQRHEDAYTDLGDHYGATGDHGDSPKSAMTPGKGNRDAVEGYPSTGKPPTVHLQRLRKEFSSDLSGGVKKVAVDGFDLKLFEDQITVILGHNGAGKTTTLNMLTGMLPMTSGDCIVYGTSVKENLRQARAEIGFCPQHNILWDQLTCMEHLQYIGRLKGLDSNTLDSQALEMLRRVDLVDKKDVFSQNLSGGQKRKLSVAIAFMGGSRLILLDEPTAGMDAAARRHTWDLLKEMSVGRTIVLTTHFMDEADLLGNRIAIMSKGALHSYGSSMFLKSRLGTGYALRLSLAKVADGALATELVGIAQRVIPSARLKEHKGQEVAITLPNSETSLFPTVIELMESKEMTEQYHIHAISMSVASLEDVFVRIAYEEDMLGSHEIEDKEEVLASQPTSASKRSGSQTELLTTTLLSTSGGAGDDDAAVVVPINKVQSGGGAAPSVVHKDQAPMQDPQVAAAFSALDRFYSLMDAHNNGQQGPNLLTQLIGLLMKRFHNSRRDRRTIILQVFLPLGCIVLAMLLADLKGPSQGLLWLDSTMYGLPDQQIVSTNCQTTLVPGFNTSSFAFAGESLKPYQVLERNQYPSLNQSYDFSTDLLTDFYHHGEAERNIAYSCNDAVWGGNGSIMIFTNQSSFHALPEAINEMVSSAARTALNNNSIRMRIGNYPLPLTDRQTGTFNSFQTVIIGFFILIPFTFVPSTFVSWVVKERECKAKHLQFVSGVNYFVYWVSNYLFDLASFLVTELLALLVFVIFNRTEYIDSQNCPVTFMVFLLYGLSAIAAAYCVSFLFNNHSSAQTIVMLGNFLCGFVLVITMYILKQLDSTKAVANVLVYFFRIVPAYCLGEGILALATAPAIRILGKTVSVFELDQAGWGMIYMSLEVVVFSIITLALDHPKRHLRSQQLFFDRDAMPPAIADEDEDVKRERDVIEKNTDPSRTASDIIQVHHLRKVYHTGSVDKVAVQSLSFGVRRGEVFGFLGTNGAGKTTTMSILTGEFLPSMGHASVSGHDVVENTDMSRRVIGYCPQFDALIDLLTPEEHLRLYAALRSVPKEAVDEVVEALLTACALQSYRGIRSKSLSGGNKRKLSVALSLIGGPKVVFLDEPSAGMDPHARRQLWDVILYIAQRSSVVLTTHHLEEVDVLAHRVGIMVDGALKCIGSLDYLKHRFGNGYEVAVKIKGSEVDATVSLPKIEALLVSHFPGTAIVEFRQQKVTLCVPFHGTKLSQVFRVLGQAKDNAALSIEDYTVQQTSLEQVFLRISEKDEDEAPGSPTSPTTRSSVVGLPPPPPSDAANAPLVRATSTTSESFASSSRGNSANNRSGNRRSSIFYIPPAGSGSAVGSRQSSAQITDQ